MQSISWIWFIHIRSLGQNCILDFKQSQWINIMYIEENIINPGDVLVFPFWSSNVNTNLKHYTK